MLRPTVLASLLAIVLGNALAGDSKTGLQKEFGTDFRVIETDHWLIVTNASKTSADETAWVLEETHDTFYREWSSHGAKSISEPLVCVSFANVGGLANYREKLGISAPDGRGFYSVLTNRIVLCDVDKEPEGMVRKTKRGKGETRKHSRTAHEAAHQLAFNSGIQVEGRPYPIWFGEGLAGNYEPESADDRFGLTTDRRSERIAVIRILRANDDLIPLSEFAGMPHSGKIRDRAQVIYPQAAAFFRFLFISYPDEFKTYQRSLASLRIRTAKRSTLENAFTKAFGSIEDLEKPWEEYLDRVGNSAAVASKKRSSKPRRRGVF